MLVLLVAVAMMVTICLPMFVRAEDGNDSVKAKVAIDDPSKSEGETDGIIGTVDDKGTISVSGITTSDTGTITVTAYKIVEAQYDENTKNFTGYEALYDTITDFSNITQEQLASLVAPVKETTGISMSGKDGTYTATVPVGRYLILIEGAETKIYNPVIASVQYKNADGENVIDGGSVDVIASENAWVKVSDVPTVDKKIVEDNNRVKGNTANIGDIIDYEVIVKPIPNYGGDYPKFELVDTLSAGLTYVGNLAIQVKNKEVTLTKDTHYTATAEENKLTINFVIDNKYKLNDYAGDELVITYQARLNQKANVNEMGNSNDAKLIYSKDSKVNGEPGESDSKTYTYTFDIDGNVDKEGSSAETEKTNIISSLRIINKIGEVLKDEKYVTTKEGETKVEATGIKSPLKDAEFTLYDTAGNIYKNYKVNADGSIQKSEGKEVALFEGTTVSNAEGQLHIYGLEAGTYYLQETKAPDGYSLNTHRFEIVIQKELNDDGTLAKWSVTIDGQSIATFNVTHKGGVVETVTRENTIEKDAEVYYDAGYDINNTKLTNLPSTGGIGTYIFTIVGVVIMVAAAGLFFARRKKA
jgi:fimbrial isopeptide formation D2 family protein/LPXTG-motif cell wall-anchored protein